MLEKAPRRHQPLIRNSCQRQGSDQRALCWLSCAGRRRRTTEKKEGRTSEIATFSEPRSPWTKPGPWHGATQGRPRANGVMENRPVPDQSAQIARLATLYRLPLGDTVLWLMIMWATKWLFVAATNESVNCSWLIWMWSAITGSPGAIRRFFQAVKILQERKSAAWPDISILSRLHGSTDDCAWNTFLLFLYFNFMAHFIDFVSSEHQFQRVGIDANLTKNNNTEGFTHSDCTCTGHIPALAELFS